MSGEAGPRGTAAGDASGSGNPDPGIGETVEPIGDSSAQLRVVDPWSALRELTPARIGLGRAGDALRTGDQLALRLAHAQARDAVHAALDVGALRSGLHGHPVIAVRSAAPDRATYLQRPDLGRALADGERERLAAPASVAGGPARPDLAFVLADGLSPLAVQRHAARVVHETVARLDGWTMAPVVIASQARVALGDAIGEALGARFVVVLVGERPGLSSADSLGAYLTFEPRIGRRDSERNCISNIRPPVGLSCELAADKLTALLQEADRRGLTGVDLKDDGPALQP